jgi:hypothetical protein
MTERGANVSVTSSGPSIDLNRLLKALNRTLENPDSVAPSPFRQDGNALTIDIASVMHALVQTEEFRALGEDGERSFLQNVHIPRGAGTTRLGSRVREGTDRAASREARKLRNALRDSLSETLSSGLDPAGLAVADVRSELEELGKRVGGYLDALDTNTRLRTVRFAKPGEAREPMARVISAIETSEVSREAKLEDILNSLRRRLVERSGAVEAREYDEEIKPYYRDCLNDPDSQVSRLFDFLENQALSRLRLCVRVEILCRIAAISRENGKGRASEFERYVRNICEMFATFVDSPDPEPLDAPLGEHFGASANFDLGEEFAKSGTWAALPVFAEWQAQMFESVERRDGEAGPEERLRRDVSYRFRINGDAPEAGVSAFANRLDALESQLCGESPDVPKRRLAQLVLLSACVPDDTDKSAPDKARELIARLAEGGTRAAEQEIARLRDHDPTVVRVADRLVRTLRGKRAIIGKSTDRICVGVAVLPDVIDEDRFVVRSQSPLKARGGASETADLLQYVTVCRTDKSEFPPQALCVVEYEVELSESHLDGLNATREHAIRRELPEAWTQIAWRPVTIRNGAVTASRERIGDWSARRRIDVLYAPRLLGKGRGKTMDRHSIRRLAAARVGFSVLSYLSLAVVLEKVSGVAAAAPHVSMLRFQQFDRWGHYGGDERDDRFGSRRDFEMNGDQGAYAASQATEFALACDWDVRMQGLVDVGPGGGTKNDAHRRRGVFSALLGGFPIFVSTRETPRVEKIGLLTVTTRLADSDPSNDYEDEQGQVFIGRSYVATAQGYGYRITRSRAILDLAADAGEVARRRAVIEEIRRLKEAEGVTHLLLVSHEFGDRRVGRTLARRKRKGELEFFNDYPLSRDMFPATRLKARDKTQDAFEIVRNRDHELKGDGRESDAIRDSHVPVYTIATLNVVGAQGEDAANRPQSGFSTYYLLRDQSRAGAERAAKVSYDLTSAESETRGDLLTMLRGVHYLESEARPEKLQGERRARPVLDAFPWIRPSTSAAAGDIMVESGSRSRMGSVEASLTAVLARVRAAISENAPETSPKSED